MRVASLRCSLAVTVHHLAKFAMEHSALKPQECEVGLSVHTINCREALACKPHAAARRHLRSSTTYRLQRSDVLVVVLFTNEFHRYFDSPLTDRQQQRRSNRAIDRELHRRGDAERRQRQRCMVASAMHMPVSWP